MRDLTLGNFQRNSMPSLSTLEFLAGSLLICLIFNHYNIAISSSLVPTYLSIYLLE